MAVKKSSKAKYTKDFLLDLYRVMVRIRTFEQHAAACAEKGLIPGRLYLCAGQEAAAAGAFSAMQPQDFFTSTHRCLGHVIARGGSADLLMAELMGKRSGYCGGRGGPTRLADAAELHHLGGGAGPGAGNALSAGSALASGLLGDTAVTVAFLGDGASNEGSFHEALNLAAAWTLPVVWLIENNGYAGATPIRSVTNTPDLAERAAAYGVPFAVVNGCNATDVYAAMKAALAHARGGKGPYVVEAKVFRRQGHCWGDDGAYLPQAYTEKALSNDCIALMRARLKSAGMKNAGLDAVQRAADAEMAKAVEFAAAAPDPDPARITADVYTTDNERCVAR